MTDTTQAANFDATSTATPGPWSHLSAAVLIRAAAIALVLGSILSLVNQADAIFGTEQLQLLPLILVYATPFIVVTVSHLFGVNGASHTRPQ